MTTLRTILAFWMLLPVGCAVHETVHETVHEGTTDSLADGVYEVVPLVGGTRTNGARTAVIALQSISMEPRDEDARDDDDTVLVLTEPILRFRDIPRPQFRFEGGECDRMELDITEAFREFTRRKSPSRLAVVVGGRVVSSHKIRGPIESDRITVTSCTPGGIDHVRRLLKGVVWASRR